MQFIPATDDIKVSTDKTVQWRFEKSSEIIFETVRGISEKTWTPILAQLSTLFLMHTGQALENSDAIIYYDYSHTDITFYTYFKTIV